MEYYGTRRKESTNTGRLPDGDEVHNRSQYPHNPEFCNHAGSNPNPFGSEDSDETHSGTQQCPDGG